MALTENGNNLVMPVAPMYGGGGGGMGGAWGDFSWIILLVLFALFGNGGFGGFGGFGGGGLGYDFPWLLNGQQEISSQVNDGFRDQMIDSSINQIQNGVNALSNQICNGFAGVEQGANARQIANMQQAFASQTAITSGMNDISMALQNCCCENRAGIADLKYTVATENCADRTQSMQNTRDIIDSQTRGTQAILDKLCTLELDGYKRENDQLRTQLNLANLTASQTAQTAQIERGQLAATTALVNELRSCPIPSQPVYGSQPIFSCPNQNSGCGCGGNSFYN